MAGELTFLDPRFPIVDEQGRPSAQFMIWFQENIGELIAAHNAAKAAGTAAQGAAGTAATANQKADNALTQLENLDIPGGPVLPMIVGGTNPPEFILDSEGNLMYSEIG